MADQDKVDWDNHVKKNPHIKDKLKILSWSINVKWSDGEEEKITEIPDEVAQYIDDYLTEIEGKANDNI